MPESLHLFSYGTLQPGQRYWHEIAQWVCHVEPATLEGYALWHFPERGYPAITPDENNRVHGSLITTSPACIDALLRRCDDIEGVASHLYRRECLPVAPQTSPQTLAFVYIYHPDRAIDLAREGQPVDGGHWLKMMRAQDIL